MDAFEPEDRGTEAEDGQCTGHTEHETQNLFNHGEGQGQKRENTGSEEM
jgi:hypothetical protein